MKRLTEKTDHGTWSLKGVPWMMLHAGVQMTEEVRKALYGALCKLMHYEDTGLAPDQIWEMDGLYREKCGEVNQLKAELAAERQKHRWIPVEERLPDKSGMYIVQAKENDLEHVTFCKWQTRYKRWDLTGSRAYWKVIAWKPLPDPYQPEKDCEDNGTSGAF